MSETSNVRIRNPYLATVVNIPGGGLGHLYVGKPHRYWIGFFAMAIFFIVISRTGLLAHHFIIMLFWCIAVLALILFILIDPFLIAKKETAYKLRWFNRWYFYLAYLAFVFTLNEIFFEWVVPNRGNFLGYETYSIAADSMAPALVKGDFIMIDASRKTMPVVGQIIAVKPLADNTAFVRRVVSVSAESVEVSVDQTGKGADSRQWGPLPLNKILGTATYIFYSADRGRIGRKLD